MSETDLTSVEWCQTDQKDGACLCARMHRANHEEDSFSVMFTDRTGVEIGTAVGFPSFEDAEKYGAGKLASGSHKKRLTATAAHIYVSKTMKTFVKTVLPVTVAAATQEQ